MRISLFAILFLACISISANAVEAPAEPKVPADVAAALDALPYESRPMEMRRAVNGAIYAKLRNGCEIIVQEKHSAPVVSVQGWMRTGGVNESTFYRRGPEPFLRTHDVQRHKDSAPPASSIKKFAEPVGTTTPTRTANAPSTTSHANPAASTRLSTRSPTC